MYSRVPEETNRTGYRTSADVSKSSVRHAAAANRASALVYQLRRLCNGRESHAAGVSLTALLLRDGRTVLLWRDEVAQEGFPLGFIQPREVDVVIERAFAFLRGGGEPADAQTPPTAAGAAGGGRA